MGDTFSSQDQDRMLDVELAHQFVSANVTQRPLGVDGDVSDSSYSSDNDNFHLDLNTDLIGVQRTTKDLNIVNQYRPRWTCKEAFRESYQNWRDGILRSFDLDQSRFRPTYTESLVEKKRGSIIIEARHPDTKELLGFIQLKSNSGGYCVGGLKIVNFNATLKYSNLGTGATTKAHDNGQTGQHGDGMKLSALVYRRNNYNVHYESGEFKWRFLYKKGSLACSLSRISEKRLEKMQKEACDKPRDHTSQPWKDVCLVVAAPGPTRDINGFPTRGKRLSIAEFKNWITVTLDINPPKDIIRTIHGDLIRDPGYRGRMYLRGLLLPRGGTNGDKYLYGYNFVNGHTSSDREALSGMKEESESISAIWSAAIRADESSDSQLVSDYTNLLLSSINKKGDVMMPHDPKKEELMPGEIARRVWAKMLTLNKDDEGRTAFYYSASEGKNEVHIIEKSLRKNPVPIDPELWRILRKYFLCKTPSDELLHRFKSAQVVHVPDNSFAFHMNRMLNCLLLSSPATRDMKLSFVNGEHLDIDAGFFGDTWKVHSKWLTWEGAHEQTFCEEDQSAGEKLFSCDHAVLQLWDIMISQLMATGNYPQVSTDERWLKSMARNRLSQMPRSVKCFSTQRKGELSVTWGSTDSHSHSHSHKPVKVVLSRLGFKHELPLHATFINHDEGPCACPYQISKAISVGVIFSGLDMNLEYLPRVSRDVEGAFIAISPKPMKPLNEDAVDGKYKQRDYQMELMLLHQQNQKVLAIMRQEQYNQPMPPQQVNPVLEDYQMQLMLLEHQNKQRLLMARGGHDNQSRHPQQGVVNAPDFGAARSPQGSTVEVDAEPILSSVETGSHSAAADLVGSRGSYRPSRVSDDDEMEDSGSLYRPPSTGLPPSVPVAPPAPPSPKPPSVRSKSVHVDLTTGSKEDSYVLGTKIEHKSLDWGGSFPGSHDFYRTRNEPDQEIYILKPKFTAKESRHKRMQSGAKDRSSSKKSRASTAADRSGPSAYIVLSSPESESDQDTHDVLDSHSAGSGLTSMTPRPEKGITYRY